MRSFPKAKKPWEISHELLLSSKRDDHKGIRRRTEVRKLYQFLERGLKGPIQPGTLRTVPADTGEQKAVKRVAGKDGTMKNTDGQQSLSGNTLKDSQGNQLTYEGVLRLLEVKELPFLDTPELKGLAVRGAEALLTRYPPEWFKEHRVRLIEELEQIAWM